MKVHRIVTKEQQQAAERLTQLSRYPLGSPSFRARETVLELLVLFGLLFASFLIMLAAAAWL